MELVEINAGAWYLRAHRADDKVDDRPAMLAGAGDRDTARYAGRLVFDDLDAAGEHVAKRAAQWDDETYFAWAIAEPTTGEFAGEISLNHLDPTGHTAELGLWIVPKFRGRGAALSTCRAVMNFGFAPESQGGLGMYRIEYHYAESNTGSAILAGKLGFIEEGRRRGAAVVEGNREAFVATARLVTDPAPS